MNREIQSIIYHMQEVNEGEPWFGRAVFEFLGEIDLAKVNVRPGSSPHSLLDLLYHMNTWADFVLKRISKSPEMDPEEFAKLDWRPIDPSINTWEKGVEEYKSIHKKIEEILENKEDDFLDEIVEGRKFTYRTLVNGLIEHDIYHLGQIAFLKKLL